jgi:Na+/H+ antiporter
LRAPYPAVLALGGAATAATGMSAGIDIDPELLLALLVAPALLNSAYDFSLRDLKRNWRGVVSLAVVLVVITTIAVACLVRYMAPSVPWAAAIALGAIVAPPDAVAATAVLQGVQAPRRLVTILEGEAMLNDASSLLIYRLALLAYATGEPLGASVFAPTFLLAVVGSLVVGVGIAYFWRAFSHVIPPGPSTIIMQFVATFALWVVADRLQLSPILTIVAYAMALSRLVGGDAPARLRLPSFAVWDVAVTLANICAFVLIGLGFSTPLYSSDHFELMRWSRVALAVLGTVIVVRLIWTLFIAWVSGLGAARQPNLALYDGLAPGWRTGLMVGWAGSRGIVTVATALALPANFPERNMMLLTAFTVTLGTLVAQGMTLRPLVIALKLRDNAPVDREIRLARVSTAQAAIDALAHVPGKEADWLRETLIAERDFASKATAGDGRPDVAGGALVREALAARRTQLSSLRQNGAIGDAAFQALEEEFDILEIALPTPK